MKYSVEVMRVREQTIQLNGWAVENDPDSVITYRIEDEAGNPVDAAGRREPDLLLKDHRPRSRV